MLAREAVAPATCGALLTPYLWQCWGTLYSVSFRKRYKSSSFPCQLCCEARAPSYITLALSKPLAGPSSLRKGASGPCRVVQPGLVPRANYGWSVYILEGGSWETDIPAKTWGRNGFYQCQWGCAGSPGQITTDKGASQVLWSKTCRPTNLQKKWRGKLEGSYTVKVQTSCSVCSCSVAPEDNKKEFTEYQTLAER